MLDRNFILSCKQVKLKNEHFTIHNVRLQASTTHFKNLSIRRKRESNLIRISGLLLIVTTRCVQGNVPLAHRQRNRNNVPLQFPGRNFHPNIQPNPLDFASFQYLPSNPTSEAITKHGNKQRGEPPLSLSSCGQD